MALGLILALALSCTPSTDIKKMPDGNYSISPACYQEYGELRRQAPLLKEKVQVLESQRERYEQLLALSNEQIELQRSRAELWRSTAMDYQASSKWDKYENWIHFAAGFALMYASYDLAGSN